ncbi:NAD(P)-dependent oxidoreductase [Billgrantia endophytica]|nr:NAD(P)-dependent oxidoreductase [Halomonas endophytica]
MTIFLDQGAVPSQSNAGAGHLRVGYIGLGQMGHGMAANILRAGHSIFGYDVDPKAMSTFRSIGGVTVGSVREAVGSVDVVITSLPGPQHLEQVALSEDGLLNSAQVGTIWIDCSTVDVSTGIRLRDACTQAGIEMVDAPVTGGAERASSGDLTVLVGGDDDIVTRLNFLFRGFAKRVHHLGPFGAGYAAKLCQLHLNYLVATGVGEAFLMAARFTVDVKELYLALQKSCAQSYVLDHHVPQLLAGDYDESFNLGLAVKDLGLICDLGESTGVELSLGRLVYNRYKEARDKYGDTAPHLSIIRLLEDSHHQLIRPMSNMEVVE